MNKILNWLGVITLVAVVIWATAFHPPFTVINFFIGLGLILIGIYLLTLDDLPDLGN